MAFSKRLIKNLAKLEKKLEQFRKEQQRIRAVKKDKEDLEEYLVKIKQINQAGEQKSEAILINTLLMLTNLKNLPGSIKELVYTLLNQAISQHAQPVVFEF